MRPARSRRRISRSASRAPASSSPSPPGPTSISSPVALSQVFIVGLTTAIRQPWLTTRVRVRQWGRLPRRRGPTVLIANHQHEDESEIIVERAFVQGGLRPLFTASSRRMYEPGFFADRMPWLAPFMRTVNAGPLFLSLGMLPLENELSARPLRSIAQTLRTMHGNLAVDAVFRGDALARVPPAARTLDDLLSARFFRESAQHVRLSHVLEPYRGELLADLRAGVQSDIARIVDVVRRGATFFVTPEGFYSTDGRMRPLKGIVEHLVPIAEVWFAAIAFDPFRGRRLSLLYRVVQPADRDDLATSLRAARPITTSALLARWIIELDRPFTAEEALDALAAACSALPPGAFVDPELERGPRGCAHEAVRRMTRRGLLQRDGERLRLSNQRADPRFGTVPDIVAHQAAFAEETFDALRRLTSQ